MIPQSFKNLNPKVRLRVKVPVRVIRLLCRILISTQNYRAGHGGGAGAAAEERRVEEGWGTNYNTFIRTMRGVRLLAGVAAIGRLHERGALPLLRYC